MSIIKVSSAIKLLSSFILMLNILAPDMRAQDTIIYADTSDYQPMPEGLNINLSIAASKGYTSEIIRLLALGADINNQDDIGATPLIYAVANNRLIAVEKLLEYSPDPDIETHRGESALHIAVLNENMELAELLIRDSADINITDNNLCTPIHFAAIYNYFYLTDLLIYYNAEINVRTTDGTTPLMAAVWAGNAAIADLLIKYGADVNLADNRGFTPLHVAAQNGDTLITSLLLDAGADIRSQTEEKYDIGSIAAMTGDLEYSKFLIEKTGWADSRSEDSVEPFLAARGAGQKDTYIYFRKFSSNKLPALYFDRVSLTITAKLNYDFYTGGQLSFIDPLHKIRINAGIEFKPMYTRVLEQESEDIFYQYEDKRYVLYTGFGKDFLLTDNYFRGSVNIMLNLNLGYMFCSYYKGTDLKPDNRMLIIPSAGVERTLGNFSFYGLYEYMQTGLYKAGPHWLKFGASYYIPFGKNQGTFKDIKWY